VGFTLQPEAGVRAGQQVVVKAKVVEVGREVPLLAAQFERAVGRSGLLFSLTHASPALPILYLHLSLVTRPKALSSCTGPPRALALSCSLPVVCVCVGVCAAQLT
jgi:hypothetical protein